MEIVYVSNEVNKIKTEVVKISNDSMLYTANYFCKDTILFKTKSKTKNNISFTEQIVNYVYNSDKTLKQSSFLNQYIDVKSIDKISSTPEIITP